MTALEVALTYISRGWNPVSIPYRAKKPIGDEWQHRVITAANAAQYFNNKPQNIGGQMGPASGGLTDADLDCDEAIAIASYILPRTNSIFGRASARLSHWLYITDLGTTIDAAALQFHDPKTKEMLVELRIGGCGKGAQTVFPGSTHDKTGEAIEWFENGEPARVTGLDERVRLLAAACLLARYWPTAQGSRHTYALTVGGFLSRVGLGPARTKVTVEAIAKAAGDEEWRDRRKAAEDAGKAHQQGKRSYGLKALRDLYGPEIADRVADWLGYQSSNEPPEDKGNGTFNEAPRPEPAKPESNHSWDEPDISLLDDRRGDVPDFPLDALGSSSLQDWITRAAHGAGTLVPHVAVPLLGIASSLIGTARRVQASRSFAQPMTCWTALVGNSGAGKTPGIDATKRALAMLERNRKAKNAALERAHDTRVETAKFLKDQWRDDLRDALKEGKTQPVKPLQADDPGKFVTPRLFVSDSTIERLGVLLQARPQGILLLADELAGLFLNMSRYTTGQDNEFWLEAWNGSPYVIERMNRPAIFLDYLLIGMVGGLQPDKLVASFKGDEDGMYARVLFAWPDEAPYRPLTDTVGEIEPEIVNALDRLCKLGGDGELVIRTVPLTAGSRDAYEDLREEVSIGKAGLEGRERDWWAKMPAHTLRLAGTLCLLNWAMNGGQEPADISAEFMRAAVTLTRYYFWPHARAALRLVGLTEHHANARRVLRWIKSIGLVEVSREDIRRDALAQSLDADETQTLIERLERAGWLRKTVTKPLGAGRPSIRYTVNPQLMR